MLTISPIQESDFEPLAALFGEFARFLGQPDKMTNTAERMHREREHIRGYTAKTPEGVIVGYTVFFFAYHTWRGKCLYMDDLYITEAYRGQGVGRQLIERVIAFARASGCAQLRWQVSATNDPAIRFYESLGAEFDPGEINCRLPL